MALNDFLLWEKDETTGRGRLLTPAEGKARRAAAVAASRGERTVFRPTGKYELDD